MEFDNVLKTIGSQYIKECDRYYMADSENETMYLIKCYEEESHISILLSHTLDNSLNKELCRRKINILNDACHSGVFSLNDSELVYKSTVWFTTEPTVSEIDELLSEMCSKLKAVLSVLKSTGGNREDYGR